MSKDPPRKSKILYVPEDWPPDSTVELPFISSAKAISSSKGNLDQLVDQFFFYFFTNLNENLAKNYCQA